MTRRGLIASVLAWPSLANAATASAQAGGRVATAPYGPDPRQRLEMFAPARSGVAAPVVVILTGGDRAAGRRLGRAMADQGFLGVAAGVRAAPGTAFADFIADAARAVGSAAEACEGYGGDPGRLTVLGWGDGAHAAWMLARDRRYMAAVGRTGLIRAVAAITHGRTRRGFDAAATRAAFSAADQPPLLETTDATPSALAAFLHDRLAAPSGSVSSADAGPGAQ